MIPRSLVQAGRCPTSSPSNFVSITKNSISGNPVIQISNTSARFSSLARKLSLICSDSAAANAQAISKRYVATTTTSKTHQLAPKQAADEIHISQRQHRSGSENVSNAQSTDKYQARLEHMNLWHSIDTIKRLGFRLTQLDPLDMAKRESLKDLAWSASLIDELRTNSNIVPTNGFLETKQPLMPISELIDTVYNIYTNSECGLEYAHITNQQEIEWLTSQWERLNEIHHLDKFDQYNFAKLLLECEAFDHFMASKYPSVKRYGCEGAESMLIVLDETLRLCHLGDTNDVDDMTKAIGRIDDVIIGMPHRGRLNLMACLLGFEPMAIFNKTRGELELNQNKAWMAKGDVLSHLSMNTRFVYGVDRQHIGLSKQSPDPINVTVLPNPSHLEIVSPVTMGVARGRAHNMLHCYTSSPKFVIHNERTKPKTPVFAENQIPIPVDDDLDYRVYLATILPIQIHGDASVAGQGIIQEMLQMSNLPKFTSGGSLHLIVNNQIGYTTLGDEGRSSRHCSDIFKIIEAPIIHVNAQNISSVVRATRLALSYRQRFHKDVAINLVCYRQHGHNELDEPSFTQPQMYETIRQRNSIPRSYCDDIRMDPSERERIVSEYKMRLNEAYKRSDRYKQDNDNYRNFKIPRDYYRDHICSWDTGYNLSQLRQIALDSVDLPDNFQVHPNLQRVLINERRDKFLADKEQLDDSTLAQIKVDWATSEMLAFGSLLKENNSIRLAGQDVERGTFSTRHAVLCDQSNGRTFVPLNENIVKKRDPTDDPNKSKAQLEVSNTILSEEAALAYEFGYSIETCGLTIWEAQFGDFFNTAQSIIDTLISSSESKWLKQSALTLILPHGLDGAGPEHSSSHIERFLQMSSSSMDHVDTEGKCNWSICNPTLPSQYFHLLRRQVLRPFRKPLVLASPKIIFRHPKCQSKLEDFGPAKSFESVLDDPAISERAQVDTVVLCSGKVYFQLDEEREKNKMNNVAIIRLEELCPFPINQLVQTIEQYPNVDKSRMFWLQEEHKNQGAYSFVATRLANLARIKLNYIGRSESELPATGTLSIHRKELEQMVKQFHSLRRS